MKIRGKLVKIDMGEMEGKSYGDIHIASERGNIVLRYPLGAEIDLPEIGSVVEVEFSGQAIRTLVNLTLISLPEKIDKTIPLPTKEPAKPERYPNAFWNKSYMGFGISTKPLAWILMIGFVCMAAILYSLGNTMTHWYYTPDWFNLIRDTHVSLSYGSALIALVCGILVGITKQKNLSTAASILAIFAGVITALFWSSLLSSELLVQSEEPFAELYFYVSILFSFISFISVVKDR